MDQTKKQPVVKLHTHHAAQALSVAFLRMELGRSDGNTHAFASKELKICGENSISPPRQRTQIMRNRKCCSRSCSTVGCDDGLAEGLCVRSTSTRTLPCE